MLGNPNTTVDEVMDAGYECGAVGVPVVVGLGNVRGSHFACCSARGCGGITNGEDRIRGVP